MTNKVDFSLKVSAETAARFDAVADSLRFTREQTLTYLLDLYNKVKPERAGFPRKRPVESHLHTRVQPDVKSKFYRLAREYGLNRDQMLSVLIDIHDQCPERAAGRLTWSSGMGAARTGTTAAEDAGDAMAQVDAALDVIRRAFRGMDSGNGEIASLREQLARSRAEAREAEETYRRKLLAIAARLRELA